MHGASFTRGAAYVLLAVTLWGAQFPVAKSALGGLAPDWVNISRYSVAVMILVSLLLWREGRRSLSWEGRFKGAAMLGSIGMAGSAICSFFGLTLTPAEHGAIISALQPTLAALAHWRLHGARPPRATQVCIALAFTGVVMVVTRGDPNLGLSPTVLLGDLLLLGGSVCWVFYTLQAAAFNHWSPLRFTTLTMIPAAATVYALAALGLATGRITLPDPAAAVHVWPQVAYLALAGVVSANLLWNAGNQRIGGVNSALLINLMPVVTITVQVLRGQRFGAIELIGVALVVGSLAANNLIARRVAARHPVPRPQPEA